MEGGNLLRLLTPKTKLEVCDGHTHVSQQSRSGQLSSIRRGTNVPTSLCKPSAFWLRGQVTHTFREVVCVPEFNFTIIDNHI